MATQEVKEPALRLPGSRRFARDDGLVGRRAVLGAFAASALVGSARAADPVETVEITPALIAAAQREGRVLMRYSCPVDEATNMGHAFEAAFGIKVQLDRKVGVVATQLFATEERAGQHIMDVNFGSDPPGLRDLADEGLYLRYTLPDLASKLAPSATIPGLGYCPRWTDIVLSYNPSLIPHEDARKRFATWHGLLDPSLVGRIGLTEPAGGGVAFAFYLMLLRTPDYGRAFLEKLAAQKPRLYPGSAGGREDLAAGAISVFVPNWEGVAMAEFLKGDRTAWMYPERLPSFANTFLSISAHAPHPAAARLFSAWVFTPEGAKVVELAQNKSTLRGHPDGRAAVEKLRETSWWQPLPTERAWVPDQKDWDENYETLLPQIRQILGWRG